MSLVRQSIETVKYRLGKMDDGLLKTLDIPVHARDYFCTQPIILKPSIDVVAAIHSLPYIFQDKNIEPVILYHPVLDHVENQSICLKFMAHEAGHALIYNNNVITSAVNMAASFKRYFYAANALQITAATAVVCLDKQPRRRFFKEFARSLGFLGLTAAQVDYLPLHQSRNNERKADRIADALMPEYTLKEAFTDFDACCINTDIYRFADTTETFPELRALFAMHPSNVERFAASEKNCKKFAKNSLLWD